MKTFESVIYNTSKHIHNSIMRDITVDPDKIFEFTEFLHIPDKILNKEDYIDILLNIIKRGSDITIYNFIYNATIPTDILLYSDLEKIQKETEDRINDSLLRFLFEGSIGNGGTIPFFLMLLLKLHYKKINNIGNFANRYMLKYITNYDPGYPYELSAHNLINYYKVYFYVKAQNIISFKCDEFTEEIVELFKSKIEFCYKRSMEYL